MRGAYDVIVRVTVLARDQDEAKRKNTASSGRTAEGEAE